MHWGTPTGHSVSVRYLQALLGSRPTAHKAPQESTVCALSTTEPSRREQKQVSKEEHAATALLCLRRHYATHVRCC